MSMQSPRRYRRRDLEESSAKNKLDWRSNYNPCTAAFVPPPWELVEGLVDDLCAFCNDDSLPAIAQAAIAHAQFETIHPFVDGNGRTGRALVHMVMRRRGLAPRVQPPISLVLATISAGYIEALGAYRYTGDSDSAEAVEGVNRWVALFAGACVRAVEDAEGFEDRMREIEAGWRARLGSVRRGSSVDLLLGLLPGAPVVTVGGAAAMLGRTFAAVNNAVDALVSAGILRQVNVGRRNRAFESAEVIEAFIGLERQLASPADDTRRATHSPDDAAQAELGIERTGKSVGLSGSHRSSCSVCWRERLRVCACCHTWGRRAREGYTYAAFVLLRLPLGRLIVGARHRGSGLDWRPCHTGTVSSIPPIVEGHLWRKAEPKPLAIAATSCV